jgi:alpha-tubulin suppressor-like RCC1 family protein
VSEKDYVETPRPYLINFLFGPAPIDNILTGHSSNKFVSIACGDYHSVGIRLDGSIAIW